MCMYVEENKSKSLVRIWTLLFVLLLILLMSAPAKADVEPRYYGGKTVPFYLFEKSQVKIFLHSPDGLKKSLVGTFVLNAGQQNVKTMKNGTYSLKFDSPPKGERVKSRLSKEALAELRLASLMREVRREQAVANQ